MTRTRSRTVRLADGGRVRLRPISPNDKPLLAAAFERMSVDSRYRRFFRNIPELTPAMLVYLTEVDHVDHEAIVAVEPEAPDAALGVVRYVRAPTDLETAEVAFAVVDDWQGRGLGRALLTYLARRAREEGIRRFTAIVKFDNAEALRLLRSISEIEARQIGPELELTIDLPAERGMGQQLRGVLRAAAAGALTAGRHVLERAPPSRTDAPLVTWRSIRTIVVGTDGSGSSQVAVDAAADLASRLGATLWLVCAYPASGSRPDALSTLANVQARLDDDVKASCQALEGEPAAVLFAVAEERAADLLVVGNKGMTGPGRIMGSVPNTVSHHPPCSVLIVRTAS
jgi:nucleotide-binding universal stress UspA family protein/ribosomal protein S18 acetylase RimI-like enzyme